MNPNPASTVHDYTTADVFNWDVEVKRNKERAAIAASRVKPGSRRVGRGSKLAVGTEVVSVADLKVRQADQVEKKATTLPKKKASTLAKKQRVEDGSTGLDALLARTIETEEKLVMERAALDSSWTDGPHCYCKGPDTADMVACTDPSKGCTGWDSYHIGCVFNAAQQNAFKQKPTSWTCGFFLRPNEAQEVCFFRQTQEVRFLRQAQEVRFPRQAQEVRFLRQAQEVRFLRQAQEVRFLRQAQEAQSGSQIRFNL
jgi:hypothetical protein